MTMNKTVFEALGKSYTAYHASDEALELLEKNGFERLSEDVPFELKTGGKYYVRRGLTAVIAFKIGDLSDYNYKIVATHIDSPALKLKYNPVTETAGMSKLNVETYGGGIWSSFVDVPLKIAGKLYLKSENEIFARTYTDPHEYIIPNVAIHMNRKLNDGYVYNPQTDLAPLFGLSGDKNYFEGLCEEGERVVGYDLYAVNATKPFFAGANDEFLCSPRLDNLACAFCSVDALTGCSPKGIAVCFLADNEEVGSSSAEGANSDFLRNTLKKINAALGFDDNAFAGSIARSFLVSADNAHALHPNHPELSDPTNRPVMGGGIVIKHHANKNYTTDGLSSAIFEQIMQSAGVKTQHFFMRSDLRCGSTLGTISLTQIAMKSVDIGLGQLAMHSSLETMCAADADSMSDGLRVFYDASYKLSGNGCKL